MQQIKTTVSKTLQLIIIPSVGNPEYYVLPSANSCPLLLNQQEMYMHLLGNALRNLWLLSIIYSPTSAFFVNPLSSIN